MRKLLKVKKDDSSQGADYGAIFYDVFVRDNGGFDIVLANPPYVRQEDIDRNTKEQGKKNYSSLVESLTYTSTSTLVLNSYSEMEELVVSSAPIPG